MAVTQLIRRMNKESNSWVDSEGRGIVTHGFRSTFKDWVRNPIRYNHSMFDDEVSELQLAHVNSDATRTAYARDNLLVERAQLMTEWAEFCDFKNY